MGKINRLNDGLGKLARHSAGLGLIFLATIIGLTACSGASGEAVVASAEDVDLEKTLVADEWEASLTQPPGQEKIVGEGSITYQAEGTYLIVFVEVKNSGSELQVVPRDLLTVVDEQNQEIKATRSAVQVAYILPHDMELLLDSPLPAGESRQSVVIYDIPDDARGLKLTMQGTEENLNLGF